MNPGPSLLSDPSPYLIAPLRKIPFPPVYGRGSDDANKSLHTPSLTDKVLRAIMKGVCLGFELGESKMSDKG